MIRSPLDMFVFDEAEYNALLARARTVLKGTGVNLPDMVFAEGFSRFVFMPFDDMLMAEFWDVLAGCARQCGDREIAMLVHDPDPASYYFPNFGRYAALRADPRTPRQLYEDAIFIEPEESPADALRFNTTAISWFGDSGQWAFWGDHDYEIGIGATRCPDLEWPVPARGAWSSCEDALDTFMLPVFRGWVPPHVSKPLRRHYGGGQ